MVRCGLCDKIMYGNMPRHLRCVHPKAYIQWQKEVNLHRRRQKELKEAMESRRIRKCFDGKKRSSLWEYYEDMGSNMCKCKVCGITMKHNKSRHLEKKHPNVYRQYLNERRTSEEVKPPAKDVSESRPWARRGWVKRFLRRLDDRRCECTVCHKVLRMPVGDNSNMKRHVRTKHPFYYQREVKAYREEQKQKKEIESGQFEVIEYLVEDLDSDDPLLSTDHLINEIERKETNVTDSDKTDPETENELVDDEVFKDDSDVILNKSIEFVTLSLTDPNIEEKIKELCVKDVAGARSKHKTCFWNFFFEIDDNLYRCMFCEKDIVIFPKSVANLKRHISIMHRQQFELILKYAPHYDNCKKKKIPYSDIDDEIKLEFEVLEHGCYKCKICSKFILCGDNSQMLTKHVEEAHRGVTSIETESVIVADSDFVVGMEEEHEE
ncbi:uncharacterized protein LOC115447218 [Manduca sexta]|uniref:uncharacterized protein LOC115447218 n=1 Tax=Manduca sexta TaxID=7130 RepID=UPI00188DD399|nr:uncharacterized protein LOC115447218 [Manduca sexta]